MYTWWATKTCHFFTITPVFHCMYQWKQAWILHLTLCPVVPRKHSGNNSFSASGTGFLIHEPFTQLPTSLPDFSSLESSSVTLQLSRSKISSYRPPSLSTLSKPFSIFLENFNYFLSFAATTPHKFIYSMHGSTTVHADGHTDRGILHGFIIFPMLYVTAMRQMINKLHSQLSMKISMDWVSNGNLCSFLPNVTVIVILQVYQNSVAKQQSLN